MKKSIKVIAMILLVFLSIVIIFSNKSFASGYRSALDSIVGEQDSWDDSTGTKTKIQDITATVIATARIIGVTAAVVMLLVLAMKYMSAAPSEKAEIKKSAVVYVVGAVVLFGVVGILGIIEKFSSAVK